jgi:hypothetical protein
MSAAGQPPGDRQLGHGHALGRGDRAEPSHQGQVVVQVLGAEAGRRARRSPDAAARCLDHGRRAAPATGRRRRSRPPAPGRSAGPPPRSPRQHRVLDLQVGHGGWSRRPPRTGRRGPDGRP